MKDFGKACGSILTVALLTWNAPAGRAVDFEYAAKVKVAVSAKDPQYEAALKHLIAAADESMAAGPWSVTDKKRVGPSKDPKDYISFAPYFWPDHAKPDGLPYINRDGQRNPEAQRDTDHDPMQNMLHTVRNLSLAAYFTGDAKYADRAGLVLRRYFVDPKTSMNPNMNYAQAIPGITEGRGIGIIDVWQLSETLDAIRLMESVAPESAWSKDDRTAFRNWCSQFLDWMMTSKNGMDEQKAANNHGDWFDATASGLADFVGKKEIVESRVQASEKRVDAQVEADGKLPQELRRTLSWHYPWFAIEAFILTSEHGKRNGFDLWHHQPADLKSGTLNSAVSYLLTFSETGDKWPYKNIGNTNPPFDTLLRVRSLLTEPKDTELANRIDAFIAKHRDEAADSFEVLTYAPIKADAK